MLNYGFKIDVNVYSSRSYPIAVYRKRLRLFARWEHIESFEDQAKATEFIAGQLAVMRGLPKYF